VDAAAKRAGFGVVLAVTFAAALGGGAAVGPIDDGDDDGAAGHGGHADAGTSPAGTAAEAYPGGLLVSDRGYTLELLSPALQAGVPGQVALRILDADGAPVTAFDALHERQLHLIVVDRQLTSFQHVHPTMAADGTWTVDLALAAPGAYRLFTDVAPSALGEALTLGADLVVPGELAATPDHAPRTSSEVDGYTVTLTGDVRAGTTSDVVLTVERDGEAVTDLDPYLGAYGHLVALRADDLAYLHVHPTGEPGDGATRPGPEIGFGVAVPGPGTYRLFLDFQHEGVVRTADLTVVVPPGAGGDDAGHADDGHADGGH
jgi:hypothetical protein